MEEVLGLLCSSGTATDVKGLPAGNVLYAEAAKGNGVANAMLARVLFKATLQQLLGTAEITTPAERPQVVGIFNEIWYNLLGNKTALYQNADAKKQGKVTMVSILETADGKKFFDQMATLAKIADGDLKPAKPGKKGGLNMDSLVKELVSKDEHVRELAALKLRLLGQAALPDLKKFSGSNNEQLAEAAKALHDEITDLAAERKKEVPPDSWFLTLRPTLQLLPKTEDHDGVIVRVMKLKLPKQAQDLTKQFEQLLGPDWDKVRFAILGKNVVVVWGTNTALLDETLKNLQDDKSGLAESKHLQTFYKHSTDARRVEMHTALSTLLNLLKDGPDGLLLDATFRKGFACLAPLDLSFDVWLFHPQIGELADLARAFPDTKIVLDHCGGPIGVGGYANRREEIFTGWKASIQDIAKCRNVVVKLGGLAMKLLGYDFHERAKPPSSEDAAAAWRPYIET